MPNLLVGENAVLMPFLPICVLPRGQVLHITYHKMSIFYIEKIWLMVESSTLESTVAHMYHGPHATSYKDQLYSQHIQEYFQESSRPRVL